jgi:16S rRNA (adenine1518-N6/adenine1519-N6)-dimethyltransferase
MPAKAFFPVPKVDSTFIKIEFYEKLVHKVDDEDFLFKIIRQAFGQRRKKIINSLSCFSPNRAFFASLGVDSHCRAENITLEKYINFANQLKELHA